MLYDARGYLNDLSLYDSSKLSKQSNAQLTDEELEQERLLNIERFADLKDEDETEDEPANNDAAVVSGGQYSNVGYQYENSNTRLSKENGHANKDETKSGDTFKAPHGLNILPNLTLPETNKHHHIIEKTALFVAQQGSQMEILLKTKQASNSSFDFLSIDSPLNQYYKFLLNEIKMGKYIPNGSNGQEDDNDSDDDSDDGNYLHPSLLSSKSQNANNNVKIGHLTNVFNKSSEDDSYSQLVKHFKDKFADDIDESSNSDKSSNSEPTSTAPTSSAKSVSSLIPQPPSDVEAIIIKLAEHVGKNGDEFEKSIKALGDKKFEFLNPGHVYHPFYVKLKISEIAKYRKPKKPDLSRTIAFSIAAKEPPKKIHQDTTITRALKEGAQQLTKPQKEEVPLLSKEQKLQLERKKKALEFINLLRKGNNMNTESIPYGPDMPKDNIQLSPTIEAITSPNHSPTHKTKEKVISTKDCSVLPFTTDDALIKDRHFSPSPRRRNTPSLSPPRRYKLDSDDDDESPDRTPARYRRSSSRKRRHRSRSRSKDRNRRHKRSHKSSHRSSRRSKSKSRSRSRSPASPRKDDKHRSKRRRHESSSHRKNRRSQSPS